MNLFEDQIPLTKPWLGDEEWLAIREVIQSGWVSQGPKVMEFEELVSKYIGVKFAVATNSCTSAIHLAFRIQGVQSGDDVILADTTCMANVNAIKMAGANPVFVDIDKKTFNLDPHLIEQAITPKTKAILNIDQIGLANDLEEIKKIAQKHNLIVVDDAATAMGGKYNNTYLGSHGLTTTFSFHPRKMITTGEGGMLLTDDQDIADKARTLRSAGASVSDLDRHKAKGVILQKYYENGYNYRMTDIQAAIGIIQMSKIDQMLIERRTQAAYYDAALKDTGELQAPFVPDYATHSYSSYCITISENCNITPEEIINQMAQKNISCRFGIPPLHNEPYFSGSGWTDAQFPVSCNVFKKTFFIPIFPGLTEKNLKYIMDTLHQILYLHNTSSKIFT
ncbi:MAG: DegT/DnrJ/EryC1/StrS aminotransferase [Bacteroidota bacterium]|nr:DegT/DnrJ/EryC1/StrS aminotransferase [Bacteroidota bacterium]